jgi:putative ABC transport system permease protein
MSYILILKSNDKMKTHPLQTTLRFFRWYCHPKLPERIEGDLMEVYDQRVKEMENERLI